MEKGADNTFNKTFTLIAAKVTRATGSPAVVILAFLFVIIWGATGPIFHYSEEWQLVINTSTTIITFIMVFIIQHSQNKDTTAIQLKLNELIAANKLASNRLVNSEALTEKELETLKLFYKKLSDSTEAGNDLFATHSVDEAKENLEEKKRHK
jgi:low affinity Fe/Cu permease